MNFPTYPIIGQHIDEFTKAFGKPASISKDGNLVMFEPGINDASLIETVNLNGDVHNISFSIETFDASNRHGVELFANHFLPVDHKLVTKVENKVIDIVNADVPISIYEYYSESVKGRKGFVSKEDDKGYITIYICHEDNKSRMVVALGREEAIQ